MCCDGLANDSDAAFSVTMRIAGQRVLLRQRQPALAPNRLAQFRLSRCLAMAQQAPALSEQLAGSSSAAKANCDLCFK